MSDRHSISPYPVRMPLELRQKLEEAAKDGSRSLHAEIISRLDETFLIQEALKTVAPGAPVFGTAGLLLDMDEQLREQTDEKLELAASIASAEIKSTLSELATLPLLTAALALQVAHPEAVNDHQRERLIVVIARMVGSDSRDPAELMSALSARLIDHTLAADLGV